MMEKKMLLKIATAHYMRRRYRAAWFALFEWARCED